MIRFIGDRALIAVLLVLLAPACLLAQDGRPHSVLVLDQSNLRGPFYYQLSSGLREVLDADGHVTTYGENLDLTRFGGAAYEATLKRHLEEKYRDRSIGVIVANGAGTLDHTLRWREELWPGVPIVFAMLEASQLAGLGRLTNVTGVAKRNSLAGAVKIARVVIPDLDTIVLIGDSWDRQALFRHWGEEIPAATSGLKVIDLVGKKMSEILRRVAELPDRSAIVYSGVFSDGAGTYYPAATAMRLISEKANRPIVVAAEPLLAAGAIGGYSLIAREIGVETGKLALRILNGERAEDISPVTRESKPLFNWKQMQRWNVSEASLPEGSEIRFREPTFLEQYRWQSMAVISALVIQAALITFLLHERHLRRNAEMESHERMTELAHVNRQATTGELSSSIAHELNQPLCAMANYAQACDRLLAMPDPDIDEVRQSLQAIASQALRAGDVIRRLRSLARPQQAQPQLADVNPLIMELTDLIQSDAKHSQVRYRFEPGFAMPQVLIDQSQIQQLVLNLIRNSIEALTEMPAESREILVVSTRNAIGDVEVSVSDRGPGVLASIAPHLFTPFCTSKATGTGLGLAMSRTIARANGGRLDYHPNLPSGACFTLTLPAAPGEAGEH